MAAGDVVKDTTLDRVGEVMDPGSGRVFLRPLGGGREWEADPNKIKVISPDDVLRLKVQLANDRSLGRSGTGR